MTKNRFEAGDIAIYRGERYIVRGFTRLSLERSQYVELEDPKTGRWQAVPLEDAYPLPAALVPDWARSGD